MAGLRGTRVILAFVAASLIASPAAGAAVDDGGSKIAFASGRDDPNPTSCFLSCNYEIYAMTADGSGAQRLTTNPAPDRDPQWSPDGTKIAWVSARDGNLEIYVMNADGTGQARLTTNAVSDYGPTWSPDGSKIAFSREDPAMNTTSIWAMNADGTGPAVLAPADSGNSNYVDPDWAPDGSKIVFVVSLNRDNHTGPLMSVQSNGCCLANFLNQSAFIPDWSPDATKVAFHHRDDRYSENIWAVDADGTNLRPVTNDFYTKTDPGGPSWSPHGIEIAYSAPVPDDFNVPNNAEIIVVNEDGTDRTNVTNNPAEDLDAAWQPMLVRGGYVRPKGATPISVSLVPGFVQCTTPNRTHGAPLGFGSCSPPFANSAYLTVGTPDANGEAANSVGSEQLKAIAGNLATPADEADIRFTISITDVRKKSDFSDYEGQLRLVNRFRLTDANTVGGYAATMRDYLSVNVIVPCVRVPTAQVGGPAASSRPPTRSYPAR